MADEEKDTEKRDEHDALPQGLPGAEHEMGGGTESPSGGVIPGVVPSQLPESPARKDLQEDVDEDEPAEAPPPERPREGI